MQQSPHSSQSYLSADSSTLPASHSTAPVSALQQTYVQIPRVRPSTPLLDAIDSPKDIKSLNTAELITLADELRLFLLYSAGQSGGHFGANLGVIERANLIFYNYLKTIFCKEPL